MVSGIEKLAEKKGRVVRSTHGIIVGPDHGKVLRTWPRTISFAVSFFLSPVYSTVFQIAANGIFDRLNSIQVKQFLKIHGVTIWTALLLEVCLGMDRSELVLEAIN